MCLETDMSVRYSPPSCLVIETPCFGNWLCCYDHGKVELSRWNLRFSQHKCWGFRFHCLLCCCCSAQQCSRFFLLMTETERIYTSTYWQKQPDFSFSWWWKLNQFLLSVDDSYGTGLCFQPLTETTSFYFQLTKNGSMFSSYDRNRTSFQSSVLLHSQWDSWQCSMCGQFNFSFYFNVFVLTLCSGGVVCQFSAILAVAIFGMELIEGISNPHVLCSRRPSCCGM